MAAQSARAHTFDRRMRWFWLRRSLRDTGPVPADVEDVVDLRDAPGASTSEPAPVAPVAPLTPAAPAAPPPRLPHQRG